jgi:hypothetical protein
MDPLYFKIGLGGGGRNVRLNAFFLSLVLKCSMLFLFQYRICFKSIMMLPFGLFYNFIQDLEHLM